MRVATVVGCLIVIPIRLISTSAADPTEERKPVQPRYVVCAPEEDAEFGSSLFRVLRGKDKVTRFDKAKTIEKALASEADVLVLVLPKRELPKLEKGILEALKKRKIIGIGFGAAELFGQLGLEINGGECAHGFEAPPSVTIGKSELLGELKSDEPILVLHEAAEAIPDADKTEFFGVFLPPHGENSTVVDVIARWTTDANYAPIARQGNCVLIAIPVPATRWTAPYADLIRDMCQALRDRKLEAFSTPIREATKPGTYEFKLARRGSIDSPFTKTFYFRVPDAQRISAKLEHAGSDAVMMMFRGQDEVSTHATRVDASQGETLKITAEITREDIEKLGDRYWVLDVTNFGDNFAADCNLTITIENP